MTSSMVDGIKILQDWDIDKNELHGDDLAPTLQHPAIGKPIAHAQVIALSKILSKNSNSVGNEGVQYHLDDLLRGSKICYEAPKPKTEPTSEYKALMARLRREEEARAYERMINPPRTVETFKQRFPNSPNSKLFAGNQAQVAEDDEITYADVNRQMALIINILVSIVACSIALWLVASSWSIPRRLALSMGGSILVAVAEAVVYAGYVRRVKEAREKGKKQVEIKEIIKTWIIGGDEKPMQLDQGARVQSKLRKRNVKPG